MKNIESTRNIGSVRKERRILGELNTLIEEMEESLYQLIFNDEGGEIADKVKRLHMTFSSAEQKIDLIRLKEHNERFK